MGQKAPRSCIDCKGFAVKSICAHCLRGRVESRSMARRAISLLVQKYGENPPTDVEHAINLLILASTPGWLGVKRIK